MHMKVCFILSLALAALLWQPRVIAQQTDKVYRIGFLTLVSQPDDQVSPLFETAEATDEFLGELRDLGYEEGENLTIERRYAYDEIDRLPDLAAELVGLKPDLIISVSTPATRAAHEVTSKIPIVFNIGSDPVEEGFVASRARPGGNMTGFLWWGPSDLKQLQILQEVVPDLETVAIVCPTAELDRCRPYAEWLMNEATSMGLALLMHDVAAPEDFDVLFSAARQDGAGAVLILPYAWFYNVCEELGQAAARSPLPAIFACLPFAEAGGLIGNDAEQTHGNIRLARIVGRILEGADPGEVPVEETTLYEFILNAKTARTWGIEFPESLLLRATRIVE